MQQFIVPRIFHKFSVLRHAIFRNQISRKFFANTYNPTQIWTICGLGLRLSAPQIAFQIQRCLLTVIAKLRKAEIRLHLFSEPLNFGGATPAIYTDELLGGGINGSQKDTANLLSLWQCKGVKRTDVLAASNHFSNYILFDYLLLNYRYQKNVKM